LTPNKGATRGERAPLLPLLPQQAAGADASRSAAAWLAAWAAAGGGLGGCRGGRVRRSRERRRPLVGADADERLGVAAAGPCRGRSVGQAVAGLGERRPLEFLDFDVRVRVAAAGQKQKRLFFKCISKPNARFLNVA
jgi:hypothetical protein